MSDLLGRHYKLFLIILCIFLFAGYLQRCNLSSYSSRRLEYGFHGVEQWAVGPMRWTWKTARLVVDAKTDLLGLYVYNLQHLKSGPAGVPLKIFVDDRELDIVHLKQNYLTGLYYYIPGIAGRDISIDLYLDKTFTPYKSGLGYDFRQLGIAVSRPVSLEIMPPDGIGFYEWESWDEAIPGLSIEGPVKVRWTGRQSSLPMEKVRKAQRRLFIKSLHPDIGTRPVKLKLLGDRDALAEVVFTDTSWKEIIVSDDQLRQNKVLTLVVSRTFNPKELGISDDSRDLGLVVVLP